MHIVFISNGICTLANVIIVKLTHVNLVSQATFPWGVATTIIIQAKCYNLSLGLTTKAKACKGVGQEGNPKVTFHVIGNVGDCEGMNLYTPKWAPILGVEVLKDSQIFKERL
jgi:hypothetical protein